MNILHVIIVILFLLLLLPIMLLTQVANDVVVWLVNNIIIILAVYFIVFIVAAIWAGIKKKGSTVSRILGVGLSGLGNLYYLFFYLVPEVYYRNSINTFESFSMVFDVIITVTALLLLYGFCMFLLFSAEHPVIHIICGVITSIIIYIVLHLDPVAFERYQNMIPEIYTFLS